MKWVLIILSKEEYMISNVTHIYIYIYIYVCIHTYLERDIMTYSWVIWQRVSLLKVHSHLMKGLNEPSSKLVESIAAPLHGSPLIFHRWVLAFMFHWSKIEFKALTACKSQCIKLNSKKNLVNTYWLL